MKFLSPSIAILLSAILLPTVSGGHPQTVAVTGGMFCATIPKYAEGEAETHRDVVTPFLTHGVVRPMTYVQLDLWEEGMCKIKI
jgi:hypothetical protein